MKIAVFDVDDTLIIHGKGSQDHYKPTTNTQLRELLKSRMFDKIYIYTNGTYGHGEAVVNHLNISDMISFIYGRDNLRPVLYPPRHMKPYPESFQFVNNSILSEIGIYHKNHDHEIYFFDDLEDNLQTAKSIGWKTILIKPKPVTEPYIDYVFPNIYAALLNMDEICPKRT